MSAREICDLLAARASSGRAAFEIVDTVFNKIVARLRRDPRLADVTTFELELALMDSRRELEALMFNEIQGHLHVEDAQDAVRVCLPEDKS